MYIESTPYVEGQAFHLEIRNVPAGSRAPLLIYSGVLSPIDLSPWGIPGFLGPDLATGGLYQMTTNTLDGIVPTGIAGNTLFVQALVKTPNGTRLSSMVTSHPIAPGTDPGTDSGTITFPLPLTTQEVLPSGLPGWNRVQQPVRVGVPLPVGQVADVSGVPQLTLHGPSSVGQFSTLAKWPDGSVKWALVEYLADLSAKQQDTSFTVDHGNGNFGGGNLASTSGAVTTIDTGAIVVQMDANKPDLFKSFKRAGRDVLKTTKGNLPHYWDDQDQEWTWHKLAVTTRRNGPVRAEVEVDGMFTRTSSGSDADRIYVRFYLEGFRGSSAIRATVSLRDTSVQFPEHLLFRGFTWSAWLNETGPIDVRIPIVSADGVPPGLWTGQLAKAGDDASFFQGFARSHGLELCYDPNWSTYYPFIERVTEDDFAFEGVRARIDTTWFTGDSSTGWFGSVNDFADPTFMEVNAGSGRGLLFGIEHTKVSWPAELQAAGDGRIEVAIFPHKDTADTHNYPLTYASCETRCFWIQAEDAPAADPVAEAVHFDYPLAARADLWVYNQSDVWSWRLVTKADIDAYCVHTGLRTPTPPTSDEVKTVFIYANATGGQNNSWGATQRFNQWLRNGVGGAYLNSWYEALYKADKMASTIDDDQLKNRQQVRNSGAPVTNKSYFYDNSKHMFFQAVPDWGFTRGETILLDSARNFAETLMDRTISPNVQPNGNFVAGTYGAIVSATVAILQLGPNQALDDWLHQICFEWANVVFQQSNSFGVNTSTLGWQAPIGTPVSTDLNPDGYMITWAAGKSSDKAQYGYMSQVWTDVRGGALAFQEYVHHLKQVDPTDPLIADLQGRAEDWYHYEHRGLPDDHCSVTGDYYIVDVFDGDAGNPYPDPFSPPGLELGYPNPTAYANHPIVNFLLTAKPSESAYSYGVEMHRSMAKPTFDDAVSEPVVNEFIWRYLVHYGLKKP